MAVLFKRQKIIHWGEVLDWLMAWQGLPRCSSRQGSPGRMPVPDVRWLHWDTGKYLWTFLLLQTHTPLDFR